jgi:hypothetical protein
LAIGYADGDGVQEDKRGKGGTCKLTATTDQEELRASRMATSSTVMNA